MEGNPGCDLDLSYLYSKSVVNAWCVYDSVKDIPSISDKIKGIYKAAWLLKAVSCTDLTTLSGDDTWGNVTKLTYKAAQPISQDILDKLKFPCELTTAAVCVYPARVKDAVDVIEDLQLTNKLPVAAVACGFPSGQYKLSTRLMEIEDCIADGAEEIDVVINRALVLSGQWKTLYKELSAMKAQCKNAVMKTILSVGELGNFTNIYKASLVAMMAGSDFIKTSTGKEAVNATLPVGLVMMRAIRDYHNFQNKKVNVGFKAAGGIKTSKDALNWLVLARRELGVDYLKKDLFRIGASGLLKDIEKELYYLAYNEMLQEN